MVMTPDAFLDAWYDWLTNQMAHSLLGLAVTALLAWILGCLMSRAMEMDVAMHGPALVIVAVVYFFGWEGLWQRWGAGMGDALADTAFMAIGGLLGVSAWARRGGRVALAMGAAAVMLGAGVWRRK